MLNYIQLGEATEVLSKNDVTIIGVLLFVILLMSTAMGFLWRAYREQAKYIQEQDKANLEMLKEVTFAVKDVSSDTSHNKNTLSDIKMATQRLLDRIDERLNNICKNGFSQ